MRLVRTPHFLRAYNKAPRKIQEAFDSKRTSCSPTSTTLLCGAKKYDESRDLWQARVTRDWRFYFTIEGDVYPLHEIRIHPK